MKKITVISENGNEYLVHMKRSHFYESHYEVRVYGKYKGWFGIKYYKFLNELVMNNARLYDISKFNFDLVKMAKHEVSRMESEWEAQGRLNKKLNEAEKKFEEWDGVCK